MIPVIMEPLHPWPPGVVTLHLGRSMHVDASDDLGAAAERLNDMLVAYGMRPAGSAKGTSARRSVSLWGKLPPIPGAITLDYAVLRPNPVVNGTSWSHNYRSTLHHSVAPLTPPTMCGNPFRRKRTLRPATKVRHAVGTSQPVS